MYSPLGEAGVLSQPRGRLPESHAWLGPENVWVSWRGGAQMACCRGWLGVVLTCSCGAEGCTVLHQKADQRAAPLIKYKGEVCVKTAVLGPTLLAFHVGNSSCHGFASLPAPADVPGKQGTGPSGRPGRSPCLQPGAALNIVAVWGVNQWMEFQSIPVSPSLILTFKYIFKEERKELGWAFRAPVKMPLGDLHSVSLSLFSPHLSPLLPFLSLATSLVEI